MKLTILLLSLLFLSCKSSNHLNGRIYELTDDEQLISLQFLNDSICIIKQEYFCKKIPDTLKKSSITAKYQTIRHRLNYTTEKGSRKLTVEFLVLKNLERNLKTKSNYTYIKNYSTLCLPKVEINSNEYKLRQKLVPGNILNFVNDSLVLKKDEIIFGYKKITMKK